MNRKFTYRELTLILGIVVALLVVFMFWFTQDSVMGESIISKLPKLPNHTTLFTHELFRKAAALVSLK